MKKHTPIQHNLDRHWKNWLNLCVKTSKTFSEMKNEKWKMKNEKWKNEQWAMRNEKMKNEQKKTKKKIMKNEMFQKHGKTPGKMLIPNILPSSPRFSNLLYYSTSRYNIFPDSTIFALELTNPSTILSPFTTLN